MRFFKSELSYTDFFLYLELIGTTFLFNYFHLSFKLKGFTLEIIFCQHLLIKILDTQKNTFIIFLTGFRCGLVLGRGHYRIIEVEFKD